MASVGTPTAARLVKPLMSVDKVEAKRRVLALYKAWYREIPRSILHYSIDLTPSQGRAKLRQEFMRNKDIKDIRVIDMLVIKGHMELKELFLRWKQKSHVMYLMQEWEPPKKSFIGKFLEGKD